MAKESVSFGSLAGGSYGGGDDGAQSIDVILNQQVTITGLRVAQGNNGQLLYISVQGRPGEFRTGSKILIRDGAEKIQPTLNAGGTVTTTIVKKTSKAGNPYYKYT